MLTSPNPSYGNVALSLLAALILFVIPLSPLKADHPGNPCEGLDPCLILVRHAEKVDSSADAQLSDAGFARADRLVGVLKHWGVMLTGVHSTDFARTRDTAKPSAEAWGLPIQLYDHRDLEGFAKTAMGLTGTHLISGHSNTTPELAGYLGDTEGQVIIEYTEYGLITVIGYNAGQPVLTLHHY